MNWLWAKVNLTVEQVQGQGQLTFWGQPNFVLFCMVAGHFVFPIFNVWNGHFKDFKMMG